VIRRAFTALLFSGTSLLAQYTVVLRDGRVHQCTERYTRTADGFIRLELRIGGSLTLLPEAIDFEETARRNGDEVPGWVAELPTLEEKAAAPRPVDTRPSIDYPVQPYDDEPEGLIPAELPLPAEPVEIEWSDYTSELGFLGYVGLALIILGLISSAIAGIFFLLAAFRVGVLWGLAVFFLPFAGLLFLLFHWEEAKVPFLWNLGSLAVVFLGLVTGSFL